MCVGAQVRADLLRGSQRHRQHRPRLAALRMPSLAAELQRGDDGAMIGADEGPACNPGDSDSAVDRQAVADEIRPSTAHRKLFEPLLSLAETVHGAAEATTGPGERRLAPHAAECLNVALPAKRAAFPSPLSILSN